jgi:hypothetical protein
MDKQIATSRAGNLWLPMTRTFITKYKLTI